MYTSGTSRCPSVCVHATTIIAAFCLQILVFLEQFMYIFSASSDAAKPICHLGRGTVRSILQSLFITLLILSVAACSSKGKGSRDGEDGSLSEAALNAEREGRFADGSIPSAEGSSMFRNVNFGFDSADLNAIARQNVEYNAELLQQNPQLRVVLEGHADERGTVEYNLALGAERARSVRDVLVSLGISPSRLETVSYGEEVPLDPAHDEAAWAKNRRVHFSAYSDRAGRN